MSPNEVAKKRTSIDWQSLWTWSALIATLVIFLFQLPYVLTPGILKVSSNLGEHGFVIFWILAVTAYNRTLPMRTLVCFWFTGFFTVTFLTLVIDQPIAGILGTDQTFLGSVVAPVTEEALKALPVLLFLIVAARRNRWQPSATDALVLGLLIGSGLAFFEDATAGRVSGGGWLQSIWSVPMPTIVVTNSLFHNAQTIAGHAAWSALVGLALGVGFQYRKRPWALWLPLFVFLVVVLDHGSGNWVTHAGRHEVPFFVHLMRKLLLNGQLTMLLLLVGIGIVVTLEQRILRASSMRDPLFGLDSSLPKMAASGFYSASSVHRLGTIGRYRRLRRSMYYTLFGWRDSDIDINAAHDMMTVLIAQGVGVGLNFDTAIDHLAKEAKDTTSAEPMQVDPS